MITMQLVDELVQLAHKPLEDPWLDRFVQHSYDRVSTRLNYYRFLYWLVAELHPDFCLELGVETGCASAHMAMAAMRFGGHVIGIDINDDMVYVANICSYTGCYTFLNGDSVQVAYRVKEIIQSKKIGIVFQDSSHHYQASINEWNTYSPLMSKPGIWLCDDITLSFHDPKIDPPGKSMVSYWNTLPGVKKLYPEVLNHGNTMGVVINA